MPVVRMGGKDLCPHSLRMIAVMRVLYPMDFLKFPSKVSSAKLIDCSHS